MYEQVYRLKVEKGYEYGLKVLVDLIFGMHSAKKGRETVEVHVDVHSKKEVRSVKNVLSHLSHVSSVQII